MNDRQNLPGWVCCADCGHRIPPTKEKPNLCPGCAEPQQHWKLPRNKPFASIKEIVRRDRMTDHPAGERA